MVSLLQERKREKNFPYNIISSTGRVFISAFPRSVQYNQKPLGLFWLFWVIAMKVKDEVIILQLFTSSYTIHNLMNKAEPNDSLQRQCSKKDIRKKAA